MATLTHTNERGEVRMVDVGDKADTQRVAVAEGFIAMQPETLDRLRQLLLPIAAAAQE